LHDGLADVGQDLHALLTGDGEGATLKQYSLSLRMSTTA
jgi:hypothetical protein